ncbi:MAG TPA: PHB depolymerase family esterase [Pyrinomonadaceae bacterium]|nr:PHB depolymerase family esterase [Pyrinomonadaceae bacterium]
MRIVKPLLLILVAALAAGDAFATPKAKVTKEAIVSEGKKRTYYLFVPEGVSASKPLPLLVVLHGSTQRGSLYVERWKDLAAKEGLIVAGPDSNNSKGWATPVDGPDFLRDLVESLKAKYPVNPRRVYLFGHSAGAAHALYMSLFESQYFAATAIYAGLLPEQGYRLLSLPKRKIPFGIWVGTADPLVPVPAARTTRDKLLAGGFSVDLTEIPNYDHWYYDRAAQINKEVWAFLTRHELSEDPQYVQYQFPK